MDLLITQSVIKHKNNPTTAHYYTDRNLKKRNSTSLIKASPTAHQFELEEDLSNALNYMINDENDSQAAAASSASAASSTTVATAANKRKELMIQELIKTANLRLNMFVNQENFKKKEPVVVEVFLIFLRVGEIDNVKERFQADAYFEASWEDNTVVNADSGVFDPHLNWEPELFIENAVGNLKQDVKYRMERCKETNSVRIHEMRNIRGIFWERLELWDFPLGNEKLIIFLSLLYLFD